MALPIGRLPGLGTQPRLLPPFDSNLEQQVSAGPLRRHTAYWHSGRGGNLGYVVARGV
jgi:hypothetical protein